MSNPEPKRPPTCDGASLAAAWDELMLALATQPEWHLTSGFYITNGGDWGCTLSRPKLGLLWVTASGGTPADLFRRAARYVRGDLVEFVNDYQEEPINA